MAQTMSAFKGRHGLGAVRTIDEFREFVDDQPGLGPAERRILVEQAEILVRDLYVHLPLKEAMHGIHPVQRLRLLGQRMAGLSDRQFHAELLDIFTDLRDLHTNYSLPAPYSGRIAFLGILVERYLDDGDPHWIVSKVAEHLVTDPELEEGVEIIHWNGMPMDLAVWRNADKEAGSNLAARYARGLETMSLRFLGGSLPPDEDWVDLVYLTDNGPRESRLAWHVFDSGAELVAGAADPDGLIEDLITPLRHQIGVDLQTEALRRTKKLLFSPAAVREEDRVAKYEGEVPRSTAALNEANTLPTTRPDDLTAKIVQTSSGTFGFLRLWTFHMKDRKINAYLNEVIRLLSDEFPPEGLILDVRGNGGGFIIAAEFLLQFLTPKRIEPEPTQFISTPSTLELTDTVASMADWRSSLRQSVETGAQFSSGIPLSPPDVVNSIGQIYHGPVVLITDAFCYSACDMFAAGFQDHDIGQVLGVDSATGAGGANVLTHDALVDDWTGGPLRSLPGGASMRVSLRRTLRVGARSGQPVEDLGVEPDVVVDLTRDDLLHGNRDLLDEAGKILAQGTPRRLRAQRSAQNKIEVETLNVPEVDVYVDGRPRTSATTPDGTTEVTLGNVAAESKIRLEGFENGKLVAALQV